MAVKHGVLEDGVTPVSKVFCDQCGKSYNSVRRLRDHVRKKHLNIPVYKCEECSYQTVTKVKIWQHKVSNHLKIKPYQVWFFFME